jgi:pimeloyl-ACP methyl ester carboxylesterase
MSGRFVEINGLPQWIEVRADAPGKPLLLFLHGGPGSAMSLLHDRYFRPLETDFAVAHWDQRGAGRTFGRQERASQPLSIELIIQDGIAVAEDLRGRFPGRALVVLGCSWGSLLGVEMMRRRPELFDAYVGAGQVVDMARGEQVSYEAAKAWSRRLGRKRTLRRLEEIGPPPYPSLRKLVIQRRALIAGTPAAERRVMRRFPLDLLAASPLRPWEALNVFRGGRYSLVRLWQALMAWRLEDGGLGFPAPVLLLQGTEDMQTPTPLVEEVFPRIRAPKKDLVLIPEAGHVAIATHAERCAGEIRARILPTLATKFAA